MYHFSNKSPLVLVVGDLMIDHYLWGDCNRISPEAPVQVIDIQRESSSLGGAGNVVNNLLAFGARVDVASVLGNDSTASDLRTMLTEAGAGTSLLINQPGRKTSRKSRIIASSQQVVRYDNESKDPISPEAETHLLSRIKSELPRYNIVLLSDYGKGLLTPVLTTGIIQEAQSLGIKVLIDPKGSDYSKYKGAFLLTPNRKEASLATGIDISNDSRLNEAGYQLRNSLGLEHAIITLSEEGMACFSADAMYKIGTRARDVYDVTGAGDTVLAALGFALASQLGIREACHFANDAAAVVVSKVGSATATLSEIALFHKKNSSMQGQILTADEVQTLAAQYRAEGKKIVFTNGCFDILHLGHVRYLEAARAMGDVLILGLNSDESVRRLKGPSRPVNIESDRAQVLAALRTVDHVVIFGQDTPYELIKAVQPHILVKGGDYEGKEVVGSDLVDEVRLVSFVPGRSTSTVIERMKQHSI